jgi:predicted Rossmann fold flavoprotein
MHRTHTQRTGLDRLAHTFYGRIARGMLWQPETFRMMVAGPEARVQQCDVAVLGAGAAGLLCAAEAGRRGRRVLLLDHADRIGKKILISGGGRANFTNLGCTWANFLSENSHFARSALVRFTPADMVALVERHGIAYHEKTLGQLFCDRSASDLVAALERDCAASGVRTLLETRVDRVDTAPAGERGFRVATTQGSIACESVVVATGGLSIPKIGATGLGYEIARQFGMRVTECRPALVPLTFAPEDRDRWCDLAGLSAEAVAQQGAPQRKTRRALAAPAFREKLLVTHRGLSGPVVLQASSYWQPGSPVEFDLAPGREVFAPLLRPRARRDAAATLAELRGVLPGRMAERWFSIHAGRAVQADYTNADIAELEAKLHSWSVVPAGTEGYAKAEVTAGGVDTAELHPQTLEARRAPGLFFIGEVVDVTGWLGGYNFQWAWASGFCAGQIA